MMTARSTPPRPDARPPRPDIRPSPTHRDPTLVAVIAIGIVSVLVAGVVVIQAAPAPAPSLAASPSTSASPSSVPTGPDGAYAFLSTTFLDGVRVPVRWNPCQPIEYQVNVVEAPPGARAAIERAIAQTSQATGLTFVPDGTTTRSAQQLRDRFYYADALHAVYRPVLITLVPHETFRTFDLPARVLAFAHPEEGNRDLDDQYVAGMVVVDGDVSYANTGRWSLRLVVQHELGHLVGLAHVRDPSELMFSFEVAHHTIPNPIDGWGPGDLQGLEQLGGDEGCLQQVRVAG